MAEPAPRKRVRRAERPRPVASAVPHAHALGTPEVDWLIHERMRLAILSALAVNDSLTFNELKALIHATDGNLSVHARKLEQARYISCAKTYEGRLPKTEFRITEPGRRALLRYLDHMEALISAMRERR